MTAHYLHISRLLSAEDAADMLHIAESYGSFGTYADEASNEGLGESLPQRFDAAFNYVSRGIDGAGNPDNLEIAAQRTNYFRETYAYGDDVRATGIEPCMKFWQWVPFAGMTGVILATVDSGSNGDAIP